MFKLLPTSCYSLVPAFAYTLLLFGCGAEETINNPIGGGGATDITPTPTSPHYFPMTLGSRWVYRNPDSSEWSREVAESEILDAARYHSVSYEPPIELDSIGPAEYFTYADRLVRALPIKDFNDAIRKIVLDSGGDTPEWNIGMECNIAPDVPRVCNIITDDFIFNPPGMLNMLFYTNLQAASLGELTPLRFPILPNQSYTALELRLRSKSVILDVQWVFYVDITIVAAIGNAPELVETPAGRFQDCLKIQYEAGPISINTLQFVDVSVGFPVEPTPEELEAYELTLHDELTDLLAYLMPKLGLQTVWLAPGVGPVKIETPNGIAELIDYNIKAVASVQ